MGSCSCQNDGAQYSLRVSPVLSGLTFQEGFGEVLIVSEGGDGGGSWGEVDGYGTGGGLDEGGYVLLEDGGGPLAVQGGGGGVAGFTADGCDGVDRGDERGGAGEIGGLAVYYYHGGIEVVHIVGEPMLAGEGAVGH